MVRMAQWAVVIPADRWATERLFHHDSLTVPGSPSARPLPGDDVLLVTGGDQPGAVALGMIKDAHPGAGDDAPALLVAYTRRVFDEPAPVGELKLDQPVTAVEPEVFQRVAAGLGGDRDRRAWVGSVAWAAGAVSTGGGGRKFWWYVNERGPAELPA